MEAAERGGNMGVVFFFVRKKRGLVGRERVNREQLGKWGGGGGQMHSRYGKNFYATTR